MIDISLTHEQKTALEARHTKARDKREGDRIKAVLLRSEGWPVSELTGQGINRRINRTAMLTSSQKITLPLITMAALLTSC